MPATVTSLAPYTMCRRAGNKSTKRLPSTVCHRVTADVQICTQPEQLHDACSWKDQSCHERFLDQTPLQTASNPRVNFVLPAFSFLK